MSMQVQNVRMLAQAVANSGALRLFQLLNHSRWAPGLQVLLVEDDEADAYLIRRALATNPNVADIVLAEDGDEALDLFDRRRVFPDLALVDLRMPRKDGLSFLRGLHARPLAQFPCAVLTSSKSGKDFARAKKCGAVEFVTKPKDQSQLKRTIDRLVDHLC